MAHEDLCTAKLESLGKELETVQTEYKKIVEERKSICFEGYGMGLVLGIILVIFNLYQKAYPAKARNSKRKPIFQSPLKNLIQIERKFEK